MRPVGLSKKTSIYRHCIILRPSSLTFGTIPSIAQAGPTSERCHRPLALPGWGAVYPRLDANSLCAVGA